MDTKKHNRLSSMLMEALQMLKYDYKKSRLTFMEGMQLDQRDLSDDDPEEPKDVQLMADETVDSILAHAVQEEGVESSLYLVN